MPELPSQEQFVRYVRSREIKRIELICRISYTAGTVYLFAGSVYAHFFTFGDNSFFWALMPCLYNTVFFICLLPVYHTTCHNCKQKILYIGNFGLQCSRCGKFPFQEKSFDKFELPHIPHWKIIRCWLFMAVVWSITTLQIFSNTGPEKLGGPVIKTFFMASLIWFATSVLIYTNFNALWKRKRVRYLKCLVCGEVYEPLFLKYTGRCSICASIIDPAWPPDEPAVNVELPTLEDLRIYQKKLVKVMFPCVLAFVIGGACIGYGYFILRIPFAVAIVVFAIFLIPLMIYSSGVERKLNEATKNIFLRCPFCQKRPRQRLPFGRCPNCRRKLIREEAPSKSSGGTEAGK